MVSWLSFEIWIFSNLIHDFLIGIAVFCLDEQCAQCHMKGFGYLPIVFLGQFRISFLYLIPGNKSCFFDSAIFRIHLKFQWLIEVFKADLFRCKFVHVITCVQGKQQKYTILIKMDLHVSCRSIFRSPTLLVRSHRRTVFPIRNSILFRYRTPTLGAHCQRFSPHWHRQRTYRRKHSSLRCRHCTRIPV